jgi:hypothetical protein
MFNDQQSSFVGFNDQIMTTIHYVAQALLDAMDAFVRNHVMDEPTYNHYICASVGQLTHPKRL